MKKTIFYLVFTIFPALVLYFYNMYLISIEDLFLRDPIAITSSSRIIHILLPLIIAISLIFLSLYSIQFSKFQSFYILLTVCFLIYLVISILPLFSNVLSLPTTSLAVYIMNDIPLYAGYYGGTLLFGLFQNKQSGQSIFEG